MVEKLKQAGAIIVGKTNTHEIALGVTGNNPHYGTARIPGTPLASPAARRADRRLPWQRAWHSARSARIPAARSVFRPPYAVLSGLNPHLDASACAVCFPSPGDLDHVGPLAKCVKDAALILQVISVYDPMDPASSKMLTGDYLGHLVDDVAGRKIALAVGDYVESADAEVLSAVRETTQVFESMGCKVQEVNMDWLRDAALANKTMTQSDGAAVHRDRLKEHPEMFGEDIRRRLEDGANTTSTDYILARRTQVEIRKKLEQFFEVV